MGTSRNALELSRKFDNLAAGVKRAQPVAERQGAKVIERAVEKRMRAATGGDLMLSGVNRKGGGRGKVGVRAKPTSNGVLVKATGPAHLVESDVPKHYVVSRYAKGAQRISSKTGRGLRSTRQSRTASVAFGRGAAGGGRRAVLNLGGGVYRRWTVASSKGRHPWRDGVRASRGDAADTMRRYERRTIVESFR